MQGFSDEEIREALFKANNLVPLAIKILTEKHGGKILFQPPAFIENGELTKPEPFIMDQHDLN